MTITSGTVTTYNDIDSGETLQAVPWTIFDTDGVTVLNSATQAFPLTASVDDITAFLTQTMQVYKDDVARQAATAQLQADLDLAAVTATQSSNITIND